MRRWAASAPPGPVAGVLSGQTRFRAYRALALSEKCAVLSKSDEADSNGEAPVPPPLQAAKRAGLSSPHPSSIVTDSGRGGNHSLVFQNASRI